MDFLKAIAERRSHRHFTDQKISPKDIKDILESGLLTPSPKNRQPWYFFSCGPYYKDLIVTVLKRKIEALSQESINSGSLPICMR